MIAYTNITGPAIWKSVDFVNVMTYDLMNRRDNITKRHTDILHSAQQVDRYMAIGLGPENTNLGVALYAKWFSVDLAGDCTLDHALGCPVLPLEDANGIDTGLSGTVTFEAANFTAAPDPAMLTESADGSCGPIASKKCSAGSCCSQDGFW
jgi:chitinase